MPKTSEILTATRPQSGNAEAFEALYDRYGAALYGVISRAVPKSADAAALLQEVFVEAWRHSDEITKNQQNIFTWLLRITHNTCRCRGINSINGLHSTITALKS